jgi:hypothetical protein
MVDGAAAVQPGGAFDVIDAERTSGVLDELIDDHDDTTGGHRLRNSATRRTTGRASAG